MRTSYPSELSDNEMDYFGDNVFSDRRNVQGDFQFQEYYGMDLIKHLLGGEEEECAVFNI